MLPIESAEERAAFDEIEGSLAVAAGSSFPCIFDDETAESLLVEGTAPQITVSLERINSVGLTINSQIDSVQTYDGRTKGPYRIVRWQSQDDGAFVVIGLQQV